jgi:hypothetical protein
MTRRQATLACAAALTGFAEERETSERVRLCRIPESGLQPQVAVDDMGCLHLVYYTGDPRKGDLLYVKSEDGGTSFSRPIRVNSDPGSAIAIGTIRGAQIAIGNGGRIHVAWNGSKPEGPLNPDSGQPGMPMLYTRMNDARDGFEPQRNLMSHSFGLDGGGSVAADRSRNVYVAWHGISDSEASGAEKEGEARRRVWVARSQDEGRSFLPEEKAWTEETGACGCCGMKIFVDRRGSVFALYRSATQSIHRDIYLLTSTGDQKSFRGRLLHKWNVNACPMSSMDFAENGSQVVGAWETGGQVFWARLDSGAIQPISPSGEGKGRKHPRVAVSRSGDILLAWTEGTGWQKGGSLAYQVFDLRGNPLREQGRLAGIPTWSFAAASARIGGGFLVIY